MTGSDGQSRFPVCPTDILSAVIICTFRIFCKTILQIVSADKNGLQNRFTKAQIMPVGSITLFYVCRQSADRKAGHAAGVSLLIMKEIINGQSRVCNRKNLFFLHINYNFLL